MSSTIRRAALTGFAHAAAFVDRFGWHPCEPGSRLDLWSHLNVAAGKAALEHGEHADDVNGLMGYLLAQHLETNRFHEWEAEPGRTADEVRSALTAAAGLTVLPHVNAA
ncbi:hypothetical protein GTY41_03555 [Streptomyces sp. SID685]|uniref:DUF6197 family protein n=1 Tax=Streptomyces sp. SID685 TaxID=2690322 RepID=UPI00136FDF84|nr:hypothetical protein [Streptomyces sp. SID685]MYR84041.1 hypothetical protein [Streptomyces sp. SID685]